MIRPYARRRQPWRITWRGAGTVAGAIGVLAVAGVGGVVVVSIARAPDCVTAAPPQAPVASGHVPTAELAGHPVALVATSRDVVFVSLQGWGPGDRSGIQVLRRQGGGFQSTTVIPLHSPPAGLAISPDGRLLLAALDDGVAVLDAVRAAAGDPSSVLGIVGTSPDAGTSQLAVAGRYVLTADEAADRVSVLDLPRMEAGDFGPSAQVGTIDVDSGPAGLAVSPDGRYVYVVSQVQRPVVNFGPSDFVYGVLTYLGMPRRGGVLSVLDVRRIDLDPATAVVARVPAGCGPVQVAVSPDGKTVWVAARRSNELLAFRSADLVSGRTVAPAALVPVVAAPEGLRLVRGGRVALVAGSDTSRDPASPQSVDVVDTVAALAGRPALRTSVEVGGMPHDVGVSPDGGAAYVVNNGTSTLSTLDLTSLLGS
jgi:DNA-binding beta-propeller fold protein YncE